MLLQLIMHILCTKNKRQHLSSSSRSNTKTFIFTNLLLLMRGYDSQRCRQIKTRYSYSSAHAVMKHSELVIDTRHFRSSIHARMRCTKSVISMRYSHPGVYTRMRCTKSVAAFCIVLRCSYSLQSRE